MDERVGMINAASLIPTYGGPKGNTIDDVTQFLRLRIQEGALVSRDQVPPERDLALALGVGRTTVSGALNRLQAEGYVERRRGGRGGTFVTDLARTAATWWEKMAFDPQEFVDRYEYRLAVETYAAGLAAQRRSSRDLAMMRQAQTKLELAQPPSEDSDLTFDWRSEIRRADFEFHGAIANACQSRVVARAVLDARAMLFTGYLMCQWEESRTWVEVVKTGGDHGAILAAIADGRPEKARRAMESHLLSGQTRLERMLKEHRDRLGEDGSEIALRTPQVGVPLGTGVEKAPAESSREACLR